jgi:hypothetical protein
MIISFSLKGLGPTTVALRRICIAAAGAAALGVAIYRAPVWLDSWGTATAVGAIVAASTLLVLAIGIAIRCGAHAVHRVATEIAFLGCALIAAEAILLVRAPEKWSDDATVQRMIMDERAARGQGIAYDARLPMEVVRDLEARGVHAVPGFAEGVIANPAVATAIRERGLLPLSNVANAVVVECNEGPGYLQFHSDQFGFNNPPGLASGPIDVAVIGESLALGHCVAPSTSAVDHIRSRFPRTANFGVAGSRVLSQLAVFREYVAPLEPAVVIWFVHVNFAEARHESDRPMLMRYLNDESFVQGLRDRQSDVDAFLREVVVPLHSRRDRELRAQLDERFPFPLARVIKLAEFRRVVGLELARQRPPAPPQLSHFERAVDHVVETAGRWGGRVVVAILPNYAISSGRPQDVARYEAVANALRGSAVEVVDGVALFAAEPDFSSLYTLRTDNHPNERGHAMLGEAVVAAIKAGEGP